MNDHTTAAQSLDLDTDTLWYIHGVVKNSGTIELAHKIADAIAGRAALIAQARAAQPDTTASASECKNEACEGGYIYSTAHTLRAPCPDCFGRAAQPESTTGTTGTDELRTAAAELLKYLDDHDWGGIPEGATADRLRAALARNSYKLSEQSSYDAQGVKPWRERLYMGYDECDKHEAMEAEIADLRAQLTANGQGEVRCAVCGSDEPRTGTCGSDDPRALCNLSAPASAQPADRPEALSYADAAQWCRDNGLKVPPQWEASAQPDRYEYQPRHENGMLLDWSPLAHVETDAEARAYCEPRGFEWRRAQPDRGAAIAKGADHGRS